MTPALMYRFPRARPYRLSPQDVKALVRHRDGYRCRFCGMTSRQHFRRFKRALDVHRLEPGSRYTVRGAVTCCRDCHTRQHGRIPGGGARKRRVEIAIRDPELYAVILEQAAKNGRSPHQEVRAAVVAYLGSLSQPPPPAGQE